MVHKTVCGISRDFKFSLVISILKKKAKTTHEYSLSFSSSRRFSRDEQIRYTAELLVNAISIVQSQQDWWHHRRRIELEFKAKVTSVCSIPCRASCFTLDYLKKKGRIHPIFPNRPRQNSQCAKELNKFCPRNGRDDLCFVF